MADEEKSSDEELAINGIVADTGEPGIPPLTLKRLAAIVLRSPRDPAAEDELREWVDAYLKKKAPRGLKAGLDPRQLDEAGWGVIFAANDERADAIHEALKPLLEHRAAEARSCFREFRHQDGYSDGESKLDFLTRHGAGPGPADPANVPYYLLIVGSPRQIPYRFQYQLDVQYAVGRVDFDSLEEYRSYAEGVVAAERDVGLGRRATFFSVRNPGDKATRLMTDRLVEPLLGGFREKLPEWTFEERLAEEATKARLGEILQRGDGERPALLFTASHGMEYRVSDERQRERQGAILCQDWPGPNVKGALDSSVFYASTDLERQTEVVNVAGMVTLHFACYGAGTPVYDEFAHALGERARIAPEPFVARLPQRLLARGALAAVGHVERAWGYSYLWPKAGTQLATVESTLQLLFEGHRLGWAMEPFNQRYAELSCELAAELEDLASFGGKIVDEKKITRLWTANNDARCWVVLGDPAVRLAVDV